MDFKCNLNIKIEKQVLLRVIGFAIVVFQYYIMH